MNTDGHRCETIVSYLCSSVFICGLFQNPKSFLAVACYCCVFWACAGEGPSANAPTRAEIRWLEPDHRVLLGRDGLPLAVAQLRPAASADSAPAKPVLSVAEAKAALAQREAQEQAVPPGGEQIREFRFPIPQRAEAGATAVRTAGVPPASVRAGETPAVRSATGRGKDELSVILRARAVPAGVRLLFSSAFSGPSRDDLAPGEVKVKELPLPTPLELAIQIFPNATGNVPTATFVDNVREPLPLPPLGGKAEKESTPPPPAGTSKRRARAWTFEAPKDFRVTIARSGPAEWRLEHSPDAVLLTARLLPDPREDSAFGPFVVYLGAGADEAPPEISPLKLDRLEVPARDFLEGAVRVYACGANPFVLSETAVVAEIACPPKPNGDVPIKRLPCFFWEAPPPLTLPSPQGGEGGVRGAEGEFRFRFAPPAEGVYGVRIVVLTATGQVRGDALAFRAGPPLSAGFVKARQGERNFRLDNGSIFVPLGANVPQHPARLPDERTAGVPPARTEAGETPAIRTAGVPPARTEAGGTPAVRPAEEFRKHFIALARHNGNAARLVLSLSGLALEGAEAGRFDPEVAALLDEIFRAAQARDVRLILCAESSRDIAERSASHPYFREKNGPLAATPEFFRNVAAKKLFQNRLTYLAARYGAYRALWSWELMDRVDECWAALKQNPNDPRLKPGEADLARRARRDVQEWVEEMAVHIRGMDGHEHPVCISTSLGLANPWADLERLEHLDWTMVWETLPPLEAGADGRLRDEAAALRSWAVAVRQPGRAHKPLVVAFDGTTSVSLVPPAGHERDARDTLAHNSLFASLAGGLAGALCAPWIPEKGTLWNSFTAASLFASALSTAAEAEGKDELRSLEENVEAPGKVPLRVLGLAGSRGMAVWIQDKRSLWSSAQACDEIEGAELSLPGLAEGEYRLAWLATWTGRVLNSEIRKAPPKHVNRPLEPTVVRVPAFKRDIGLTVTRKTE